MRFDSLNGRLLDDQAGARAGGDPHADTERQRPAWSGGMAGGEPGEDGSGKISEQRAHGVARGDLPAWLVALPHLAEDDALRPRQDAAQPQWRRHAIEPVRPLVDVLEKQDAAVRRIERI